MTCLEEDMSSTSTWGFPYTSNILDFIVDDDKENETNYRTISGDVPHLKMPTKSLSDDLLDFLNSEDLVTKTPTTPSVTFRSIEDPLPSYDDNFATITPANVNKFSSLNVNLKAALRAPASPRVKSPRTPFSPSDVLAKRPIKQEKVCADERSVKKYPVDPILNFESLKDVSPLSEQVQGLTVKNIDDFFKKENSMSISLDDISQMVPPTDIPLDSFSPISPHSISSEGSTDTILSSGTSDIEMSPGRYSVDSKNSTGPVKKTRRRKVTEGSNCPHLWQFILELLGDKANAEVISWTGVEHHFKVHNSRELARLWGARKNKPRMNFDKLSRAMRYYYDKNIIKHITGQRLVYEFCRNNDDTVYTKLLTEASRTMPLKPIISVTSPLRTAGAPAKTPYSAANFNFNTAYNTSFSPRYFSGEGGSQQLPVQGPGGQQPMPVQGGSQQMPVQGGSQQMPVQGGAAGGSQQLPVQYNCPPPDHLYYTSEQEFSQIQQFSTQLPYIPHYNNSPPEYTAVSSTTSPPGYENRGYSNNSPPAAAGYTFHETYIRKERYSTSNTYNNNTPGGAYFSPY